MGFFRDCDLKEESDKAAQILKSFVDKKKIPQEAVSSAKGLAIFSAFRAGMYLAGAGGSGIVVARLPDGTWSPPSAFSVRSGSIGLVWGVDMYDCVCILNTEAAVKAYMKPEMNLGGAIGVAAGPVGGTIGAKSQLKPVWTYTKSRGLYGGVTIDGTVIKERADANSAAYGPDISVAQILRGCVLDKERFRKLMEIIKEAGGGVADSEVLDQIEAGTTPGDITK